MLNFIKKIFRKNQIYTLVISWWWTKWFYALGILKWLEELWIKKNIKIIYWVSIWAIIWAYRSNWYSADEIFEKFIDFKIFWITKINVIPSISLLKNTTLKKIFEKDLPQNFWQLEKKLYIWATDINKWNFILFDKGEIINPLLWSISIPWIFPNITHKNYNLIDGGTTNNFPVDKAKKMFPHNKIIWINLNKFSENQQIKTIFDNLSISLEILLKNKEAEKSKYVDYLFYKETWVKILETNKLKLKKAFEQGYIDCIKKFK